MSEFSLKFALFRANYGSTPHFHERIAGSAVAANCRQLPAVAALQFLHLPNLVDAFPPDGVLAGARRSCGGDSVFRKRARVCRGRFVGVCGMPAPRAVVAGSGKLQESEAVVTV